MNKKNIGILIALFLGWCGGYRFYKKQYLLGVIYFFTGGLLCFGWLYDIYCAIRSASSNNISFPAENLVTSFHTRVVGVIYPCNIDSDTNRQEVLEYMRPKDTLYIEHFMYENEPAYRVVLKRNHHDIGNLSAELAKEISSKYPDCIITIPEYEITGGYDGLKYGCNIKIEIYKQA